MIHIDLDKGVFKTSGTGSMLMEEHKAITARLMHYMNEAGMDKEWIFEEINKNTLNSLASVFPEVEDGDSDEETSTLLSKLLLADFFKKG